MEFNCAMVIDLSLSAELDKVNKGALLTLFRRAGKAALCPYPTSS